MCSTAIRPLEVTKWVKSVILGAVAHLRFTPDSDRNSDGPDGRDVPLTTKVQRSNGDLFPRSA